MCTCVCTCVSTYVCVCYTMALFLQLPILWSDVCLLWAGLGWVGLNALLTRGLGHTHTYTHTHTHTHWGLGHGRNGSLKQRWSHLQNIPSPSFPNLPSPMLTATMQCVCVCVCVCLCVCLCCVRERRNIRRETERGRVKGVKHCNVLYVPVFFLCQRYVISQF